MYIFSVILSALAQSCYQLIGRQSHDKYVFSWGIFVVSTALTLLLLPFLYAQLLETEFNIILSAVMAGVFFSLWHIFIGAAYTRGGDLSLVYPLASTGILYIPAIEYLTKGTIFRGIDYAGILVIMAGVALVQYIPKKHRIQGAKSYLPTFFGACAGIVYAGGAYFDKKVISEVGYLHGTFIINFFTFFAQSVPLFWREGPQQTFQKVLLDKRRCIIGGILLFISTFTYRIALSAMAVSFAVSLRQTSSLFSVALGIWALKEHAGKSRLIGAILLLLGVILLVVK